MATHKAVVTVAPRAPLEIREVSLGRPSGNEVRVRHEWTTSGPLDLHQADGGLLVKHPQVLGGGISGTVIELGDQVHYLKVGDKVFGYGWRSEKEKAHQEFSNMPEHLLAKLPETLSMADAATIPTNLITVFHTLTTHFGFNVPWPMSQDDGASNPNAQVPILVWGGASSVGQYAIQVLRHYGYQHIIAVSSTRQYQNLLDLGAALVFDYADSDTPLRLSEVGHFPYILDCIGSREGSVEPISKIATPGSKVAIMLPVIIRDATSDTPPVYSMDVTECAQWEKGVEAKGVRTHFYLENRFFAEHLQPDIMPALVKHEIIKPNKVRIVEGKSLLERAQRAMDMLRNKEVSGEKLIWRVTDDE